MENAEEILHFLEDFSKRKPKTIPQELNEYLAHVARTGDPVFQWALVKSLFKEKLLAVITDFYETTPGIDIPPYPNVDPFNYDTMKNSLLERLDSFTSAPFTIQRICELLTYPRKQYNRVDKYMRAIEKNILVVSTREPGTQRHPEPENGDPVEPIMNGSDNNSEYNVDVEMEDMSWKDNAEHRHNSEPQPGSSDAQISVDDIEARLKAKQETHMDTADKTPAQYESVTPPELNVTTDDPPNIKSTEEQTEQTASVETQEQENAEATPTLTAGSSNEKVDVEMKIEISNTATMIIPEIKVDDAEMTEQKLNSEKEQSKVEDAEISHPAQESSSSEEVSAPVENSEINVNENSSDSNFKEETEPKLISEVSTSSEESSSSSDNTDGNSNSPKTDEGHIDVQDESSQSDTAVEPVTKESEPKEIISISKPAEETPKVTIESDNYSISDVNSELPQSPIETAIKTNDTEVNTQEIENKTKSSEKDKTNEDVKAECNVTNTGNKETV